MLTSSAVSELTRIRAIGDFGSGLTRTGHELYVVDPARGKPEQCYLLIAPA